MKNTTEQSDTEISTRKNKSSAESIYEKDGPESPVVLSRGKSREASSGH